MQRFLLFLLLIIPGAAAAAFADVYTSYPYWDAVIWAHGQGIVSGYADGSFRPDATINRAEFTKIVVGANFTAAAVMLCDPEHMYTFSDAGRSEWYSKHLCLAAQHRIVAGYPDGSFRPDQPVNFVEAAKIISETAQLKNGVGTTASIQFAPSAGQQWYTPYVQYLSGKGAVPGTIRNNAQFVTRGEVVEMMYHLSASFHKPDTDTWKTYSDVDGIFTMQLPRNWVALSPYDGSQQPFTLLADGVLEYSAPDGRDHIVLEVFMKSKVHLTYGESLLDFAVERVTSPNMYTLRTRQMNGYNLHEILINESVESVNRVYILYERDDVVIMLGYATPSTTTTAIQNSFTFIPGNSVK